MARRVRASSPFRSLPGQLSPFPPLRDDPSLGAVARRVPGETIEALRRPGRYIGADPDAGIHSLVAPRASSGKLGGGDVVSGRWPRAWACLHAQWAALVAAAGQPYAGR